MMEITASLPMINKSISRTKDAKTPLKWFENYRFTTVICLFITTITFCLVGSLVLTIVISSNHSAEPLKQICMKCSKLTKLIDRWAWKSSVQQNGKECCFGEEADLLEAMKYYFEKKMADDKKDIRRLQNRVDGIMFKIMDDETVNGTLVPPFDFSRLIDLINQVFHRQRSIFHLVNSEITRTDREPMVIQWDSVVKQGNISYNATEYSVTIHTTAIYHITIHVKFRAKMAVSGLTQNTTTQFFLKKVVQNHPSVIETYKKFCVFDNEMAEHDASVHTITKLEFGDKLFVEVPIRQRKYLESNAGSHRFIIFEMP